MKRNCTRGKAVTVSSVHTLWRLLLAVLIALPWLTSSVWAEGSCPPRPSARVGSGIVIQPGADTVVMLPVYISGFDGADHAKLTIDYEELYLRYNSEIDPFVVAHPDWVLDEEVEGTGELTLRLSRQSPTIKAIQQPEVEELLGELLLKVVPAGLPATGPRIDSRVALLDDVSRHSTVYYGQPNGRDTESATIADLRPGTVSFYLFGNTIELATAGVSPTAQEISLAVYATVVDPPSEGDGTITVTVDYDELFLKSTGADDGANGSIELLDVDAENGAMTLAVSLPAAVAEEPTVRAPVGLLHFEFSLPLRDKLVEPQRIENAIDNGVVHRVRVVGASLEGVVETRLQIFPPYFQRANVTSRSGNSPDISDALLILNHVFGGLDTAVCQAAGDVNDDGRMDLSDAVSLLTYLFAGGDQPAEPFLEAGFLSSCADVNCETSLPYFEELTD